MTTPSIVVATDFTSRADRAIDRGLQLGETSGKTIRFIHAIDPAKIDAATIADLDRKMQACVGSERKSGPFPIEFAYPEGSPPKAIANACSSDDVEMLLVGPARYNSLGDFFMGTAVDYVLRNTEKPVLVVKRRARSPYNQIVAGTDFSANSAYAIIRAARMFPDTAIHVTHAWHVPFEGFQRDGYVADETVKDEAVKMERFMEFLAEREPRLAEATTGLVRGSAFAAVEDGLERYPDALVVLGSHGASGFRQATIGSNTSDMLRFVEADILVVNTKGAAD